ncbi:hypothetical protein C4565_05060 [Candidatus Parcubacteria bacterium]|nr:MAG: hypothetical protein C4565_05060 [Candidatus Parcubacteria bacterium]
MTLTEQARSILKRLDKIKASQDGVGEAKALDALHDKLRGLAAPITLQVSYTTVLINEGVKFSPIGEIRSAIDTVKNVSMRFNESPKATTLTRGRTWTALSGKLDSLAQIVKETRAKDWQDFFKSPNNFFAGLPPSQRKTTLALTPENKKAIELYTALYRDFIKYLDKAPTDGEEFRRLRSLSAQLTQIKFQEDIPDDVRKFFEATSTGADLSLITLKVLDWLRDNNLLSNYAVIARRN